MKLTKFNLNKQKEMNLRDNLDGSCNCKEITQGVCFFAEINGSRCQCKCHFSIKKEMETRQKVEADAMEIAEQYKKEHHSYNQRFYIQESFTPKKFLWYNYKSNVVKTVIPTGLCDVCGLPVLAHE